MCRKINGKIVDRCPFHGGDKVMETVAYLLHHYDNPSPAEYRSSQWKQREHQAREQARQVRWEALKLFQEDYQGAAEEPATLEEYTGGNLKRLTDELEAVKGLPEKKKRVAKKRIERLASEEVPRASIVSVYETIRIIGNKEEAAAVT